MPFVRGRLPAAVPAVLGSVLAAAAIIWPVLQISQSIGPGGPSSEFVQHVWSWGRYEMTGDEAVAQNDALNLMPAYVLAVACLAGLLGGLAWLLRRGPDGRVLGGAGVAFALAVVGGSALERLGNAALYATVEVTGFEVVTLPAGQAALVASALLLVVAAADALAAGRRAGEVVWAGRRRAGGTGQGTCGGRRRGGAGGPVQLTAGGHGSAARRERERVAARLSGGERGREGVGFSDGASQEDRFRPPDLTTRTSGVMRSSEVPGRTASAGRSHSSVARMLAHRPRRTSTLHTGAVESRVAIAPARRRWTSWPVRQYCVELAMRLRDALVVAGSRRRRPPARSDPHGCQVVRGHVAREVLRHAGGTRQHGLLRRGRGAGPDLAVDVESLDSATPLGGGARCASLLPLPVSRVPPAERLPRGRRAARPSSVKRSAGDFARARCSTRSPDGQGATPTAAKRRGGSA